MAFDSPNAASDAALTSARRRMDRSKIAIAVALLLAIGIGGWLRFVNLDFAPIWWDEGNNAFFAHTTLPGLLEWSRLTHDTDPPVHRMMLSLWLGVFGDSAFNLRALSAVLGIGLILVSWSWGRWLAGHLAGLFAAFLVALSPMAVYYSREAKGYPVVALVGMIGLLLWARYLRYGRGRWWMWLGYVVCGALALGTHYYAVFLFAPSAVMLVWDIASRRTVPGRVIPTVVKWIVAHAAILALVGPWLLLTYDTALSGAHGLDVDRPAYGAVEFLQTVLHELTVGPNATAVAGSIAVVVLGAMAIAGAVWGRDRRAWFLMALLLASLLLAFLAQQLVVFFSPRFLLYLVPALCVLVAIGLARLRWLAIIPLVALVVAWGLALPTIYTPYAGPEEDLRPVAATLRAQAQPDDKIIVGYIWQEGALRMYAPGQRAYSLGWFEPDKVDHEVPAAIGPHPRVWVLTYRVGLQDAGNPGGRWLEQHAARVMTQEAGNNQLTLYLAPRSLEPEQSRQLDYEGGIHVRVGDVPRETAVGQPIPIRLEWQVDEVPREPYSVFIHLTDASGKVALQQDGPPGNWLVPFTAMQPGSPVPDNRALLVPEGTAPGHYALKMGVYRPDDGARLKLVSGDVGAEEYLLGEIDVLPAPAH